MFNYEDVKVKFTGEGNRVDFDRVVYERNTNTLKEMPDKEIVKLVYELRTSTAEQIRNIISKKFNINPGKVDQRIKKLVALRLITRYQFAINSNGQTIKTANMYMLDVNGKNWLEGEDMIDVEWNQKDNLAINAHQEVFFGRLVTNELISKYLLNCSTFYSYEIKPRIKFDMNGKEGYIRPNAVINFGKKDKQVHFLVYAVRKYEGWEKDFKQTLVYLEDLYRYFKPGKQLKQEPILTFICESDSHLKECYQILEKSQVPQTYTVYTTDKLIDENEPANSIAIVKRSDNGNIVIEYPELKQLR